MDASYLDKLVDRAKKAMEVAKPLTTKQRKKMKESTFCGPGRSFPVPDCKHVAVAKAYLGRSNYSESTKKKIAACINRKAKQLGCDVSKKAKASDDPENYLPRYVDLNTEEKQLYSSDEFKATKEILEEGTKEVAKIVGSKSLPTDDRTEWDGNAAEQAMRKKAGGPKKEDINWGQYGKGFVYVNADDPKNFTSYKLPFADVVGGTLKAIKGGVYAAMGAVNGARGGVKGVDRKKAYNFLVSYYKKFDEEPPEFNE